jgi:hypothetical protein
MQRTKTISIKRRNSKHKRRKVVNTKRKSSKCKEGRSNKCDEEK